MLTFVTGNAGKFAEAQWILPAIQQLDIDLEEIQSLSAEDIVRHKLEQAAEHTTGNIVVEDTSLVFYALGTLPGPFIKWFLQSLGSAGVANLVAETNPAATAITTIGLRLESGEMHFFSASVGGTIVTPRGESGFGWDPIFVPEGATKTFAEMSDEEKNVYKVRPQAFRKLQSFLASYSPQK